MAHPSCDVAAGTVNNFNPTRRRGVRKNVEERKFSTRSLLEFSVSKICRLSPCRISYSFRELILISPRHTAMDRSLTRVGCEEDDDAKKEGMKMVSLPSRASRMTYSHRANSYTP